MWLVLEQKDEQGVHNTPPPVTVSAVFIITQIVSKNYRTVFKELSVYVACRDGQINFTT